MNGVRIELKWALIHSAMAIAWLAGEKALGLHDARIAVQPKVAPLVMIPSLLIYLLALREKRRVVFQGAMSWSGGFKSGMILTAFMVALSPIGWLLLGFVISPEFFANAARHVVEAGALTEMQAAAQFTLRNFIVTGIVAGAATGALFSALAAAFTRRKAKPTQP
jgi:hypothetical protein